MHVQQKPVELIQAQVALYAETQDEKLYPGRSRELLTQLGDVGLHPSEAPELITYPRPRDKKALKDGDLVVIESAGTHLPPFDKKDYADFLRNPLTRDQSRNLAEMRKNYSQLASKIDDMNIVGIGYYAAGEHPDIVGRGSNKAAFALTAELDGASKDLVVLVDHAPDKSHSQAKLLERAASLALVKDKPGFEQGVAWSNDPPVVVAERAPGKGLDKLSYEEISAIPSEHWDTLTANVQGVADLGVQLDTMAENFYYDPEKGFTVIDFRRCTPGNEESALHTNTQQLQELRSFYTPSTSDVVRGSDTK